jgi:ABC-type cobalamin/Fe3+-siderophores transport system ATPase subunit
VFFSSLEFTQYLSAFEEDDLKIGFAVGKEGEPFSPIDQLSAGQRCTAVFPLLLKMKEGPLIVDQPEDNLDNRHIADSIAPALLHEKKTRQMAFTSHNANLVVLTDSEHIVMFEAKGSKGFVERRGFLCNKNSVITKEVIAILDGGQRALDQRYQKYGFVR